MKSIRGSITKLPNRGLLKAFRKFLQRTPFYGLYKSAGHYPDYWYWQLRGRPVRSPHLLKQRTVREYARRYGLRNLVETGTYYGEMVAAMRKQFDRIDSIEYDHALAQRAKEKFAAHSHIHIHEGDSQMVVPELLKSITVPTLFWLDAGYYGWAGLEGEKQRLTSEFEAILRHPVEHVILMDHARGLNAHNGPLTDQKFNPRTHPQFPTTLSEL